MMLYQSQNKKRKRRVWNIDKDINKFPMVVKHEESCMFFGAYCPQHKLAYTKIMTKNDFIEFNTENNIKDRSGNVRTGMTHQYYVEVIRFCIEKGRP